ncbi:MAG TPA: phosphate ABC transporter permease subunit PstC, partial [Gammaproteobacteria bacterium]|nr:phosphate ABC transporter permease subunit PstC [Gammaproteobacteria bacterium]
MFHAEFTQKTGTFKERLVVILLIVASVISIVTTIGILFSILFQAIEFFQLRSFWYFMTGLEWTPGSKDSKFGAVPVFAGT